MSEPVKHTEGPWAAHGPVVTANDLRIAQAHFGDNCEADARLIAAAPDMLAALKFARAKFCDPYECEHDPAALKFRDMADAVLAKVEGKP